MTPAGRWHKADQLVEALAGAVGGGMADPEPMLPEFMALPLSGVVPVTGPGLGASAGVLLTGAGVMGAVVASSTFLPHAPKASKALSATTARAAGLSFDTFMPVSFYKFKDKSKRLNASQISI